MRRSPSARPVSRLAVAAVTATLAAVAGAASPAYASDFSHTDRRGDVRAFASPSADSSTAAPGRRNGDLRSVSASHGPRRLSVTLRMAELAKKGDSVSAFVDVRVPRGSAFEVEFQAKKTRAGWKQGWWLSRRGTDVECRHWGHSIDWKRDTAHLSIARSCLSSPRWVRVSAYTLLKDGRATYIDEGLRSGELRSSQAFSRRLYP